jgi:hypothetical protein
MAVNLSPIWGAGAQLFDNSGNVLTGGKIYTYAAGTTTPATTYTSSSGITANSNPIILNSAGRVPYEIWLTDAVVYKFVLKDSNDALIATYDNLIGINSNFIAYTAQQEIQTATAGQTVFNLTTMQYQPATNNLSVFVDGVNQYGPGAQYAYVETDSDTVTFVSGLHVGASVKFTTASPVSSNVISASNVSYLPASGSAISVQDELRNLDVAAAGVLNPYSRKLINQIPLRNAVLDGLCTTYSYPNLFPQSFAIDSSQNEVFVLFGASSGDNLWAWIQVYDLTSGALKTTFTTGDRWRENLIIRYVSGTRYFYTIGLTDPFRVNITTLPANLSTVTKADIYDLKSPYSFMAFDGDTFTVQNSVGYRGSDRATFDIYNSSFTQTGRIEFPIDVVGTIKEYIDEFPKAQSFCAFNGYYVFGIGAGYDTTYSPDPALNKTLQGIAVFNSDGKPMTVALCNPQEMLGIFADNLGYTPVFIENQGVYSDNGKLYSLWVTLKTNSTGADAYGINICQEFSTDVDAMNFAPSAKVLKKTLDQNYYNSNVFFTATSGTSLTNPVTGADLTSFADILEFMGRANISQYKFSGTNQTITDYNGASVAVSGRMCEFYLMNNSSAYIEISGNYDKRMYWISGLPTTPVQTYQPVQIGGTPSASFNGVMIGASNSGKIASNTGVGTQSTHYEFWNTNGEVGSIQTNASRTQYHINNTNTFVTGGAGSPEGAVAARVGSLYLRTDGGAGTSLYVKESGTGDTGWVAK